MKLDEVILSARWFDLVYKTGWKMGGEYKGWNALQEFIKHKKGIKPIGYRFYTKDGVYLFYLENGQNRTTKPIK